MKILPSLSVLAALGLGHRADAADRVGAVVVYAAPVEAGAPAGQTFAAPSEAQVLDIAAQSCRANTLKDYWENCAPGRWIMTANVHLAAVVCNAVDERGDDHRLLFFSKDGVAASDSDIRREAQQRINHGRILANGCREVAVYDRDKPARTEPEESLVARSVGKR